MADAELEWLEGWAAGPTEPEGLGLSRGTVAPDLVLADHTGTDRSLSEFWADQVVLLMFWRHFGCSCGVDRANRLAPPCTAIRMISLARCCAIPSIGRIGPTGSANGRSNGCCSMLLSSSGRIPEISGRAFRIRVE